MTSIGEEPLTDLELDALTELVNLGVSRAATSLRKLVDDEVLLSVPSVGVVTRQQAAQIIEEREPSQLIGVHQAFDGDISGRAMLIFPEANSLELVRVMAGSELPLDDVIDLEQEALAETGNIILNACLATIANILHRHLKVSLPEILRGTGTDFFGQANDANSGDAVLFLYINFSVKQRNIRGYIALLMDIQALASLKTLLNEMIIRTGGESQTIHGAP